MLKEIHTASLSEDRRRGRCKGGLNGSVGSNLGYSGPNWRNNMNLPV